MYSRITTHASTTDPEAKLARKGHGKEAKLSYSGHALMDKGAADNLVRIARLLPEAA